MEADAPAADARKGVALVLLASVCFGAMGLVVKALGGRVPLVELAFFRSAIGLVPLSLLLVRRGIPIASPRWRSLSLRGVWGLLAMLCYFRAIATMPLTDAVLLNYTAPVFATLFAVLLLGERPSRRSLGGLALAFAGIVAICKPTFRGSAADDAVALGAGVFSGAAYATVKSLTVSESSWRIVWYFNAVGAVAMLPPAVAHWRTPAWKDALALGAIAAAGTLGQVLMTAGFQQGPVSRSAVPTVFVLAVATLGAWLGWDEVPDAWSWAGVAAVLVAIIWVGLTPVAGTRRPA